MAIKYSKQLLEQAYENAYYVPDLKNKLLKKIIKIINIFFIKIYRTFFYFIKSFYVNFIVHIKIILKKKKLINSSPNISQLNNQKIIDNYNKNGWVFIENFLDKSFYELLLKNWPSDFYFKYKNNPIKNYLWGFEYLNNGLEQNFLDYDEKKIILFDELNDYYNFIKSQTFKKFIDKINHNKFNFNCTSINATSAKRNSFLIPHVDTIADDENNKFTINCIHFIDGNDNDVEFSGATGIYQDNEFKEKIFIPNTLKNSLLIYNSKINFFHGFKKMKKNNYRKAIAFQFFHND